MDFQDFADFELWERELSEGAADVWEVDDPSAADGRSEGDEIPF